MAWHITPSLNQIKVLGKMSADYGESHVGGGAIPSFSDTLY